MSASMADEVKKAPSTRLAWKTYVPPCRRDNCHVTSQLSDLSLAEKNPSSSDSNGGTNFDAYDEIPVETSGSEIPPSVSSFSELNLGSGLELNIQRCGYKKPTPVQKHAIPVILVGRDLMACAQTGSGKTAAFCLPIIAGILKGRDGFSEPRGPRAGTIRAASPIALIMSPTRELAGQIHDEANKFANRTRVRVAVAYGGVPIFQQLRSLERGVDILVATPGRLVDLMDRTKVSLQKVRYLVLDEADRMLDMGFEPQIRRIIEQSDMPPSPVRQTLLFSATFPPEIQKLAADFLSNCVSLTVGKVGSSVTLITQKVVDVSNLDKRSHLIDLLKSQRTNAACGANPLTLVFVETKREADSLEYYLYQNGFQATSIHGDRNQWEREQALKSFKSGSTPIMVATDVASRGLDVPNVAHVINYDLPKNIESYVHRIGRTGRAGKYGLATAFFDSTNQSTAKALASVMEEAKQEVPEWLLQFAENSSSSYGAKNNYTYSNNTKFGGYEAYDYGKDKGITWGGETYAQYSETSNAQMGSYQAASNGFGFGYGTEQVVATGWE